VTLHACFVDIVRTGAVTFKKQLNTAAAEPPMFRMNPGPDYPSCQSCHGMGPPVKRGPLEAEKINFPTPICLVLVLEIHDRILELIDCIAQLHLPRAGLTSMPIMPWHGAPRFRGPPRRQKIYIHALPGPEPPAIL
jgi:hypothetical protein